VLVTLAEIVTSSSGLQVLGLTVRSDTMKLAGAGGGGGGGSLLITANRLKWSTRVLTVFAWVSTVLVKTFHALPSQRAM
jgi:hypothetical protein